ncbi:MAG: hypothetical protein K2X39_10585, partial [Silvanigrellaceae bacterium]|nr:hypothetical protein [Silvanigrellaceae bacterium]
MKTILLIESDTRIQKIIEGCLKKISYYSIINSKVQNAAKYLEVEENLVDICIINAQLKDKNGQFFYEKIKESRPFSALILIINTNDINSVLFAQGKGVYNFIQPDLCSLEYFLCVIKNAQEMVKLRKENSLLNSQMLHKSKLAVIGEISATVAHDIRGPLSIIEMTCEELNENLCSLNKTEIFDESFVSLRKISKACHRIKKLVDHLRNYSRDDIHEKPEYKSLDLILDESTYLVLDKIRKYGIQVKQHIDPLFKKSSFYCFPNKFEQVLMNLISN